MQNQGITNFVRSLTKETGNDMDIIVTTSNTTTARAPISGRVDTTVYWGDNTSSVINGFNPDTSHTYATAGEYTIIIKGAEGGIENFKTHDTSIASIQSYGRTTGISTESSRGRIILRNSKPNSNAVLSKNLDLIYTFESSNIHENPSSWSNWDTTGVESVLGCFYFVNGNSNTVITTTWDLSSCTEFRDMFYGAFSTSTQNELNLPNLTITSNTVESMCRQMTANANITLDNLTFTNDSGVLANHMFSRSTLSVATANSLNSWNTSNITNIANAFCFANIDLDVFNINNWDTSNIANASNAFGSWDNTGPGGRQYIDLTGDWTSLQTAERMFQFDRVYGWPFGQGIGIGNITWTTSNAFINTKEMFLNNKLANGNVYGWTVNFNSANDSDCNATFANSSFNHPSIDGWNVSSCTKLEGLFSRAYSFNQDLNSWNMANVASLVKTFEEANTFNGNISSWNTINVTTLENTFYKANNFDGDISSWNISNVTTLQNTFYNCYAFNANISNWDTSNVTNLESTFENCFAFNANISNWDTSKGSNFRHTFRNASSFNQSLDNWNISNVSTMAEMLKNTALSTENYNLTLINFANQVRNGTVANSNIDFGANNLQYDGTIYATSPFNNAIDARNYLANSVVGMPSWNITDAGVKLIDPTYAPGNVVWTPANTSTNAWFDAADSSNITTISGKVSDWNSKNGAGNISQAFQPSFRPTYYTNRVRCDVTTSLGNVTNRFGLGGGYNSSITWAVYGVIRPYQETGNPLIASGSELIPILAAGLSGQPSPYTQHRVGLGQLGWGTEYFRTSSEAYATYGDPTPLIGKPQIVVWQHNASGNIATDAVYVNGTQETTLNASLNLTSTQQLSGNVLTLRGGYIDLYELVITENLTTTDRQKIEGYLAWRWTLQDDLPVGHPYKNSAPT